MCVLSHPQGELLLAQACRHNGRSSTKGERPGRNRRIRASPVSAGRKCNQGWVSEALASLAQAGDYCLAGALVPIVCGLVFESRFTVVA